MNKDLNSTVNTLNETLRAFHKVLTDLGFGPAVPASPHVVYQKEGGEGAPETPDGDAPWTKEEAPPSRKTTRTASKPSTPQNLPRDEAPEPEPAPKKGSTKGAKTKPVPAPLVDPVADEKEPTTLKDVQAAVGQAFSRGEDSLVRKFLKANGAANVSKLDPSLWDDLIAALT